MHQNEIGTIIVDHAVKLHMNLGPGLLETVYEAVLAKQLQLAGLRIDRQPLFQSYTKGFRLTKAFGPT